MVSRRLAGPQPGRPRAHRERHPAAGRVDTDNELAQWLPDSECPICDRPFTRRWLEQYYCTSACSKRGAEITAWCEARVGVVGPPQCRFCNSYFEAELPQQKFCTRSCQDKASKLDQHDRADIELGKSIANGRRNARWTASRPSAPRRHP